MPGKSIKIGPFKKGLNNISQAGECQDDEVVKLVNFEVALDSSLTSRPPIESINGSLITGTNYSNYTVFGIYRVSSSEWYVIAQYQTGAAQWTLAALLNGDPTGTVLVINTFTSSADVVTCFAQWNDTCYFNTGAGAANVGFSWKKGASGVTLLNGSGTTMPHGNILVSWKARLWTIDTVTTTAANTIYFSFIDGAGSHPDQWRGTTDSFPVDPGSGGFVTCLLPLANSMLVFKSNSTYRFAYSTNPANGQVDRLSDYIGCSNQFSAVNFENYVYILHQGRVYELINNLFMQINKLVYFQSDGDNSCVDSLAPTVAMSAVSRRIIVQYNNTLYVYGIDTKTWSQWRSFSGTPGKLYMMPQDPADASPLKYIAASQGTTQNPSSNYITDTTSANVISYMNVNAGSGYSVSLVSDSGMTNTGQALKLAAGASPSGNAVLYMNQASVSAVPDAYNIPCSQGTAFTVAGTIQQSASFTVNAVLHCLLKTGAVSTVAVALPAFVNASTYSAFSVNLTTPANTIMAYLTFETTAAMAANASFEISTDVSIKRANTQSAITLMKLTDHHYAAGNPVEYIESVLNTKSYDYQAPANVKRIFWWAIDCVTKRDINTVTVPIAQVYPPLWGDLTLYTWNQLSQGTWGNPLLWKGQQLNIIDYDSLANSMTANGRVLAKNKQALRFRQIQFNIIMTTLGTTTTGPCKIFGLDTIVMPHAKEDQKVS